MSATESGRSRCKMKCPLWGNSGHSGHPLTSHINAQMGGPCVTKAEANEGCADHHARNAVPDHRRWSMGPKQGAPTMRNVNGEQVLAHDPTGKKIARPLHVLVPLIKEDLQLGRDAAERASMPFYRTAGEKMLEAKEQL